MAYGGEACERKADDREFSPRYLCHLNLEPSIYAALCEDGFLTLIEYSPTLSGGRHAELIAM